MTHPFGYLEPTINSPGDNAGFSSGANKEQAYSHWLNEYVKTGPQLWANPQHEVVALTATPLAALEKPATNPLQEKLQAFAGQHHLTLSVDKNEIAYKLPANGKVQELFRTPATEAGLAQGEKQLQTLARQEEQNISADFKVTFAAQGDVVGKVRETAYSTPTNVDMLARDPELYELAGVRAALEKSGPSNFGQDNKTGVKFYFLRDKIIQSLNSLATFQLDQNKAATIYVWPGMATLGRATEADLTDKEKKLPFTDGSRPESVQSAIVHELGHNQFAKLAYSTPKAVYDGTTDLTAKGVALYNQMGWQRRRDEKDSDYNWFLVGKSKDDNGQPATYLPSNSNGLEWSFKRWRLDGGAVNANGKVGPADKVQSLSLDQMNKEAVVPLPTSYFENPEEEYAESVKMFRLSQESRTALRETSPTIYKIVEQNDQIEINRAYGTDSSGRPLMVRDVNGGLGHNDLSVQLRLRQFAQN